MFVVCKKNHQYNISIHPNESINLEFFVKKYDYLIMNERKSYKINFKYFYK